MGILALNGIVPLNCMYISFKLIKKLKCAYTIINDKFKFEDKDCFHYKDSTSLKSTSTSRYFSEKVLSVEQKKGKIEI